MEPATTEEGGAVKLGPRLIHGRGASDCEFWCVGPYSAKTREASAASQLFHLQFRQAQRPVAD